MRRPYLSLVFFFNDAAPTEIYTLSLHDALPISEAVELEVHLQPVPPARDRLGEPLVMGEAEAVRSEEHTSELQSRRDLVCRLLLEKKKKRQPLTEHQERPPLCTTPTILTIYEPA